MTILSIRLQVLALNRRHSDVHEKDIGVRVLGFVLTNHLARYIQVQFAKRKVTPVLLYPAFNGAILAPAISARGLADAAMARRCQVAGTLCVAQIWIASRPGVGMADAEDLKSRQGPPHRSAPKQSNTQIA
jgi:hypothetical protein